MRVGMVWQIQREREGKKERKRKKEKERKKEKIVAKALDGQRYPCPA